MNYIELAWETVTPSIAPVIGEGGQPAAVVGPIVVMVKVPLNAPSSILAKR